MKTIGNKNMSDINGIYVRHSKQITGIPLFRHQGQEYREHPKSVELWQKNGDGQMHLRKRWRKSSISYIEYSDIPNTWVEPRSLGH